MADKYGRSPFTKHILRSGTVVYEPRNDEKMNKLENWELKNPSEMYRRIGPGDTVHAKGGKVRSFCKGGKVISSRRA